MLSTDVRPEEIAIGWWYSYCCHLDLWPIEDVETLEMVRDEIADNRAGEVTGMRAWPTREEALDELERDRHEPPSAKREQMEEIALMRQDAALCGSVKIAQRHCERFGA